MRGLKQRDAGKTSESPGVASYTGAWIETTQKEIILSDDAVASYTGAWIETRHKMNFHLSLQVASYTGAWIETLAYIIYIEVHMSHPIRVRGLKPVQR